MSANEICRARALLFIAASILFVNVQAGLFEDQQARKQVIELRQSSEAQIQALTSRLEQLEQHSADKLFDLINQLQRIDQDIAQLNGALEVLRFNIESLQKRQKDLYLDLDYRLRQLEQPGEAGKTAKGKTATGKTAKGKDLEASSAYAEAYRLYQQKQYTEAVEAFESILAQYSGASVAPNAAFWLGLSQAKLGANQAAITSLQRLVDTWPQHSKVPDALKAISQLQLSLGQQAAADETLQRLIQDYPDSDAAGEARKTQKK